MIKHEFSVGRLLCRCVRLQWNRAETTNNIFLIIYQKKAQFIEEKLQKKIVSEENHSVL